MFGKKQQTLEKAELKVVTVIGEGTVVNGPVTAKESTRIDGTVHGNVHCSGSLILGTHGSIHGTVTAKNVFASGHITGDVTAEMKIEATSTARIIGNIDTSVLVVDENAIIHGKCNMHVILPKEEDGQVKKTGKRGRPRKIQVTLPAEDEKETVEENEDQNEEQEDNTTEVNGTDSSEETSSESETTETEETENK